MGNLISSIYRTLENTESIVLSTILSHMGSTPRATGTKMVIHSNGSITGTIGGGLIEADVIQTASTVFTEKTPRLCSFDLTNKTIDRSMDPICGGKLKILIEFIESNKINRLMYKYFSEDIQSGEKTMMVAALGPNIHHITRVDRFLLKDDGHVIGAYPLSKPLADKLIAHNKKARAPFLITLGKNHFLVESVFRPKTVYLFGAGHVSREVARLAHLIDFRTVVLDDRKEFANSRRFPHADGIKVLKTLNEALVGIEVDKNSYIVILTRDHLYDKAVLSQVLGTKAGYIGMIGSKRKRDMIFSALRKEGISHENINRVHSPIGLRIGAETPEEIAVSIVAELIATRSTQS